MIPLDRVLVIHRRKENVLSVLIKAYFGALSKRNNNAVIAQEIGDAMPFLVEG